jgi:hypothetical protein
MTKLSLRRFDELLHFEVYLRCYRALLKRAGFSMRGLWPHLLPPSFGFAETQQWPFQINYPRSFTSTHRF